MDHKLDHAPFLISSLWDKIKEISYFVASLELLYMGSVEDSLLSGERCYSDRLLLEIHRLKSLFSLKGSRVVDAIIRCYIIDHEGILCFS